jgi:hypothetical protein
MKARIMGKTVDLGEKTVLRGAAVQPTLAVGTPQNRPGWPKETDKWNYSYAQFLELEKQSGRVLSWWFEPVSVWLPGQVRYKPDFLVQYQMDQFCRPLHFVEVKGWSRNLRDGITRYKIAAALFPCFTWSMVKRKGHGWEEFT